MSNEDPYRPNQGRDRGAYTPPTDDDLPFNRGGYDPRRGGGGGPKAPPMTLIISGAVLLILIIAVVVYYRAGPRASNDAPPAVGTPVGQMKADAPLEAQPIDPEAGIDVYNSADIPANPPTFVPPPEAVQPRPAPTPVETAPTREGPAIASPPKAEPRPAQVGGSSGVQIGAFSTPGLADREFAAIMSRYPQLTSGGDKRVQEVTASNGSTVYRTTVTGLSREQATSLCDAIKAAGGDCFVR
ncbi:MAG: SPOR domain-containing protein [Brevundimonas sp.]|uniref:SPOR domain-containing protein n=1 Tax=Brevundimonas sp. TaxID=1871086 RepID=UPI0027265E81|nr:SPOR domain-containing protein [Brevundimonas sp.]MDO9589319.1 SPOR domain-containing protein [Brevundimonas sp.]MDP2765537.1 SPOR domain-containing protein [Brevundimonas sp.]MDP3370468.1 SPOR domain-containing protein [Brevundimonas sp.]MDP3657863.1 SPOR domain-containing protein [Brevundimonas sp.]MDZ4112629.1 SPOR domain-containing protein [Brevundimonas sp.]